jgi:DNA-binding response OmpR family regulator
VDCDRMLRMVPPSRRQWRDAIGAALLASRNIVAEAQASTGSEETAEATLAELEEVTRAAMQGVADAMAVLLRVVPATMQDELLIGDAREIHRIAITTQSAAVLDLAPAAAAVSPIARAALARSDTNDPAMGQASTILIVDDDDVVRKTLQKLLNRLGFVVLQAEHGRDAMEKVLGNDVDLVITDMEMPVMGGMDLLRELKGSPGVAHLPVIIVSSEGDTARIIKTIELGAEDYLSKPFDPTLLQARVRASLARKRLRDVELDHLKRVSQVAAAAEAVGRDVYTPGSLKEISEGHDEIAHLARVFERMVLTVRSREVRLAQRLRLLRREMGDMTASGSTVTAASDDSPFATGELVSGRYEIVGRIGRGGMGMVYQATDAELKVDVAIKVVRSDMVKQDPSLVERL